MFRTKDHKTGYLFDHGPFHWLGTKRKRLIDQSWAKLFRETILPNLPVDILRKYYHPSMGAPTKDLASMLGVMLIQHMQDLTDEETVYQYAFNIQWHYALNVTDSDTYISLKTIWNMRSLLARHNLYHVLFAGVGDTLTKAFGIDPSLQRIDSVHIFSNMSSLGRIGLFVHTMRKFLVNLRRHHRLLFDSLPGELTDKYCSKKDSVFSMVRPSESANTLQSLGDDLFFLVAYLKDNNEVACMSSYRLMEKLLKEQCTIEDSKVTIIPNRHISSDSLQNPSDPDATYDGHKGQGYQVQLMETYGNEKQPSLITHVAVEPAHTSDVHALIPAIKHTEERDLKPERILADSLYGSDDNLKRAKDMGVDVVSPVMGRQSAGPIALCDFVISDEHIITACPLGHAPLFIKHKKDRYTVGFDPGICNECPLLAQCPVKPGRRGCYLRFYDKAIRSAKRRQYENTREFRDIYRFRSGIEGTISYADRTTGIKHLRVRGISAVSLCAVLKITGVNILRAAAFMKRKNRLQTERRILGSCDGACKGIERFLSVMRYAIMNIMHRWMPEHGIGLGEAA